MELKEFISSTLSQIINGIKDAQKEHTTHICPFIVYGEKNGENKDVNQNVIKNVSFDIAVIAEDQIGKEGGAKVSVMGIGIGGKLNDSQLSKSTSRIQFEIPISYPTGERNND